MCYPCVCGEGYVCSGVCAVGTPAAGLVWMPVKKVSQQLALPKLACLINSPLIWNLLAEQKLLHKSFCNLHSSSLSLITTDLTSPAGAAQPPTVLLRGAPPFPQPISSGSASASERPAAESGNIPNSLLSRSSPGLPGRQRQRAQLNCSPRSVSRPGSPSQELSRVITTLALLHAWVGMRSSGWKLWNPERLLISRGASQIAPHPLGACGCRFLV